ncbi:hypothetical protein HDU67_010413 [Dinochytrium kinnereticum]|nr:hypothetical protein HDU67_010413 [Dinochytrium kinnereticum]
MAGRNSFSTFPRRKVFQTQYQFNPYGASEKRHQPDTLPHVPSMRRRISIPGSGISPAKAASGLADTLVSDIIESGKSTYDLSCQQFDKIPEVVFCLQHFVTVDHKQAITNGIQLFLHTNALRFLDNRLFNLENLTVLSLRINQIEILPPQILALKNLVELSVGSNLLKYLPGELNDLPNLTSLQAEANPFLPQPSDAISVPYNANNRRSPPSLQELAQIELIRSRRLTDKHGILQLGWISQANRNDLLDAVEMKRYGQGCKRCGKFFISAGYESLVWQTCKAPKLRRGETVYPFLMRFCSAYCGMQYLSAVP